MSCAMFDLNFDSKTVRGSLLSSSRTKVGVAAPTSLFCHLRQREANFSHHLEV